MSDAVYHFTPFHPLFEYDQAAAIVHGLWRETSVHPTLHPALWHDALALGIPDTRQVVFFEVWEPLGRTGWFFDLVGTPQCADDPPDAPRFWPYNHPPGPRHGYAVRLEGDVSSAEPPVPLIAWRRRVVYQEQPPWLEARWHPETGRRIEVVGGCVCLTDRWQLAATQPPDVAQLLGDGRQLLRRMGQRGRPHGSGYYPNAHTFKTQVLTAIRKVHQKGFFPSQDRVAAAMPLQTSGRQIRTWLRDFDYIWDDMIKQALAEL